MDKAQDVADWAVDRRKQLVEGVWQETDHMTVVECTELAFARYIAAHETAPVDPALIEARELVAATQHDWPDSPWHCHEAAETRAGNRDYTLVVKAAAEGVRRGLALANESPAHDR